MCLVFLRKNQMKYFHFVVPADRDPRRRDITWQGKLLELEKRIGVLIQKNEERSLNNIREIKKAVERMEHQHDDRLAQLEATLVQLFKSDHAESSTPT